MIIIDIITALVSLQFNYSTSYCETFTLNMILLINCCDKARFLLLWHDRRKYSGLKGILNILASWEKHLPSSALCQRLSNSGKVVLFVWAGEPEAGTSLTGAPFLHQICQWLKFPSHLHILSFLRFKNISSFDLQVTTCSLSFPVTWKTYALIEWHKV